MNKTTIVQEIKREIQECVHLNKDDEVAAAIVWDTVKAVMSCSLTPVEGTRKATPNRP